MAYLDVYGLEVETDIRLPGIQAARPEGRRHTVTLRSAPARELPSLLDERRYLRNLQAYDGSPFVMLEGGAGDVLFAYGREALLHLSAEATLLRYAAGDESDPAWQRVLLDTILWTVSLLRGFELLHASAIMTERGLIALVARTGGGKSSLAAEFLRRGAGLFSDDIVALDTRGADVVAYPGPPLMNLPGALDPQQAGGGHIVAAFGDERWVELERAEVAATPLGAVVLINRVAGESPRCTRAEATSLTLLPHAVSLPHLHDREQQRFDIFSTVVEHAPVFSLDAEPSVAPSALADLVEQQLGAQ